MGSGWNVKVPKGPSIKYVRKIFQKTITIISHPRPPPPPLYAHLRVRIRGLEMLVFRKTLLTYSMDGP